MNLKDFVAESLEQIVRGVIQAQEALKDTRARVNPLMLKTTNHSSIGEASEEGGQPVYLVEFDVAITAEEGTGTKGGIGIAVGMLGLGSQSRSESKSGQESRIKFKVPLLLPPQTKE